jgi:hypothetical protein
VRSNDRYPEKEGAANMGETGAEVLFIAGFGPIDRDVAESRALYSDSLGIPFKEDAGGYLYTGSLGRFVVRRDWNFAGSGKPATILQNS